MEYTMDLGALLEPAHMWIKLLDWKKNEKQKMERPQEMCCIHVAASIKQCKWQDKMDIENISEGRSTSSVFISWHILSLSFPGLWAVSCLSLPHWVSKMIIMDFYFSNCILFQASCTELHSGGWEASVSLLQGRPWCSAPDTHSSHSAAVCGTGFTFLWICCYYLLSPLQLCKSQGIGFGLKCDFYLESFWTWKKYAIETG